MKKNTVIYLLIAAAAAAAVYFIYFHKPQKPTATPPTGASTPDETIDPNTGRINITPPGNVNYFTPPPTPTSDSIQQGSGSSQGEIVLMGKTKGESTAKLKIGKDA